MDVTSEIVRANYSFVEFVALDNAWEYLFPVQSLFLDWGDCVDAGITFHSYLLPDCGNRFGSFVGGDFPNRECHNYKNEGK